MLLKFIKTGVNRDSPANWFPNPYLRQLQGHGYSKSPKKLVEGIESRVLLSDFNLAGLGGAGDVFLIRHLPPDADVILMQPV